MERQEALLRKEPPGGGESAPATAHAGVPPWGRWGQRGGPGGREGPRGSLVCEPLSTGETGGKPGGAVVLRAAQGRPSCAERPGDGGPLGRGS